MPNDTSPSNNVPETAEPLDPGRISPADPAALRHWCQELGCTEAQLTQALAEVGDHVTAVRAWLASR